MKKYIFLAVAAAMACTASAQNNGQLHFVGADGQSRMVKASEIEKITYTGDDTNGFTYINVALKSGGDAVNVALNGVNNCEFRGVGLPDTDLKIVASTSEDLKNLTSGIWKLDNVGCVYDGTETLYGCNECAMDDRMIFLPNGKLGINTGATSQVHWDKAGTEAQTFTPDGDEYFHLGLNSENKLCVKFHGGSFPIVRMNIANDGIDETYELGEITDNRARFYAPILDDPAGGLAVIVLTKESLPVADETFKLLTAHPWKVQDVFGWGVWYGGCTQCNEEVLTFNPDGTFNITGNGEAYNECGDGAKYYYNMTGDERWTLIDNNGVKKISFFCGAFPLAIFNTNTLSLTHSVTNISETECTIVDDSNDFRVKLIPAK